MKLVYLAPFLKLEVVESAEEIIAEVIPPVVDTHEIG